MGKRAWRRFEEEIAALFQAYHYRDVRLQVDVPARISRRAAARRWPGQAYVATPRFDIVATHPLTRSTRYVECKRYAQPVKSGLVERFAYRLALCQIPTKAGLLVVQPRLTEPALELAQQYGLRVWHGATLERKLLTANLLAPRPGSVLALPYHSARYLRRLVE